MKLRILNGKGVSLLALILFNLVVRCRGLEIKDCFGMKSKEVRVIKALGVEILNGEKISCKKGEGVFDAAGKTGDTIRLRRSENRCVKIKKRCKGGLVYSEVYQIGSSSRVNRMVGVLSELKGDMWHLFKSNNIK